MKLRVHRCNFIKWMPSAVQSLAVDSSYTNLAVGRGNGDIELWNIKNGFYRERHITGGISAQGSIGALAWVSFDRLLSVGENGITEWDIDTCSVKNHITESEFNAIAVDPSGRRAVVGGADGVIRLYDVTSGVEYVRSFQRLGTGEILCLAWHPDGSRVVSGSSNGVIRTWTVSNGRSAVYINTSDTREDNPVWDVTILENDTIICGSGNGKTQFWDAKMGTLIHSFSEHMADVLSVVVEPSTGSVFSSGVDTKVCQFVYTKDGIWRRQAARRAHTLDVLQLVAIPGFVLAGALDAEVTQYPIEEFQWAEIRRHSALPQKPVLCIQGRRLLCQHTRKLCLWTLGKEIGYRNNLIMDNIFDGDRLEVNLTPKMILELIPKGGNSTSSSLSNDGRFVAWSDRITTKVYHLEYEKVHRNMGEEDISKKKREGEGEDEDGNRVIVKRWVIKRTKGNRMKPACHLVFTQDSKKLVVATLDGNVQIIDLRKQKIIHTIEREEVEMESLSIKERKRRRRREGDDNNDNDNDDDEEEESSSDSEDWDSSDPHVVPILHITVTKDNKWLAVGHIDNSIIVYNISDKDETKHQFTLPKFTTRFTTFEFHPNNKSLVVVLADNQIFMYDMIEKELSEWSRMWGNELPDKYTSLKGPILQLVFHPTIHTIMELRAEHFFVHVHLDQLPKANSNFKIVRKFKSMMMLDYIDSNTMGVVERPYALMMDNFGVQPLKRKSYRT